MRRPTLVVKVGGDALTLTTHPDGSFSLSGSNLAAWEQLRVTVGEALAAIRADMERDE